MAKKRKEVDPNYEAEIESEALHRAFDDPTSEEVTGPDLEALFKKGNAVHGRAALDTRVVSSKGGIDWQEIALINGYADKREMLEDLYIIRGLSLATMGARLGCSSSTIRIELATTGIPPRARGGRRNSKGLFAVEVALRNEGQSMEHLLVQYETPYQVAKCLNLKPHQIYSYIRVMHTKLPPLRDIPEDSSVPPPDPEPGGELDDVAE